MEVHILKFPVGPAYIGKITEHRDHLELLLSGDHVPLEYVEAWDTWLRELRDHCQSYKDRKSFTGETQVFTK